jgi:hypothetical protein
MHPKAVDCADEKGNWGLWFYKMNSDFVRDFNSDLEIRFPPALGSSTRTVAGVQATKAAPEKG